MDLGLKDCKAFVAGASKGLGKACAKALAGEGARVFICSRNVEELKRAAAEIGATGFAVADVSRPEEVKRVVAEAVAALGGLDCLVTNAGGPPTAPFEKAGDDDWDIAYQLNLMSAVRLIREALPALKASRRGRIVNLTGYGVKEPMTDLVVSDSVRAGVTVMAKTIASDLAPYGITVNNIAPGPIMTDRLTEILSARAKSLGVTPDDAVQALLGDHSGAPHGAAERNRRSLRLSLLAASRLPHRPDHRRRRRRQPLDLDFTPEHRRLPRCRTVATEMGHELPHRPVLTRVQSRLISRSVFWSWAKMV